MPNCKSVSSLPATPIRRCRGHVPRWLLLWLIGAFMVSVGGAAAAATDQGIALDPTPIQAAAEFHLPPFSIVDEQGRADGFSVELLRAALAAMGREVVFRTGTWAEVRGWLAQGEVQALPVVGRTPEREALYDFTFPYMSMHGAIVVRQGSEGIRAMEDLRGRRVAVMRGDNAEEFLRREPREIDIQLTDTFEEALRQLSEGLHDAVVIQRLVALRLICEIGMTNLEVINQPIEGFRQDFCFAVRAGDRRTLALLNEGLALVMADSTFNQLHAKWLGALELPTQRRIVIGGDHNYPPYEFLDEKGQPAGYNVDLTRAIARAVGLEVEIRLGPWSEIREGLARGDIDALQGLLYTPERDRTFDFTAPHMVNHYVGVTRTNGMPPPESAKELQDCRIVVQKGDIMHDFAVQNGLEARLTLVDAQEDALREVVMGRQECALVSRLTAHYYIKAHGWQNLNVGRKPLLSAAYCYAVPSGQRALLAELGEGLKALEQTGEYRWIYNKWMGVFEAPPPGWGAVLRRIAVVVGPLVGLLLVFALWSWSLRWQVALKTAQLQESADRFQYVFEAANVGKSITLPTGEMSPNKAFADFLGYAVDEVRGKRWQAFTPADDIGPTEAVIASLVEGRETKARFEKRYVHKSDALLWADVSSVVRRDEEGKALYLVTTVVDITERKRAEEALHHSEEFQRAMVACSPVALYTIDMEGRVTDWNSSAERIFGWSTEEILGKPLPIVPQDKRAEFEALLGRVKSGSEIHGQELIRVRKDGTRIPVSLSVAPLRNDRGDIVGIMGAADDLSERKRSEDEREKLQAQLMQAQRMESVGRLAGGVAHDYNNMLSVIIGYAELAMDKVPQDSGLRQDLDEIFAAARRSADITRQLLAFARRQTIKPEVLDLNGAVERMLRMLRRLIGEDIDLSWQPADGLWPVHMDPAQLDQILANLCVNARDAIGGVGKITIETRNKTLDAAYCADYPEAAVGDFVLLAVSDDGCGMDAETLASVFEPFFTTKGIGEGTGLGLATVYGIVRQHNGFINVYSESGKGTTFRIYLPRHGAAFERPGEKPAMVELPRGGGETVMIVEDETAILKLTKTILERLHYNVLAAAGPDEAISLAAAHQGTIQLLITDVVMPEMNGRDLARRLQSLYPDLKVLFMSGYTADVIAHRGMLEAGVHFIAKPFSNRSLAVKVREALGAEKQSSTR